MADELIMISDKSIINIYGPTEKLGKALMICTAMQRRKILRRLVVTCSGHKQVVFQVFTVTISCENNIKFNPIQGGALIRSH